MITTGSTLMRIGAAGGTANWWPTCFVYISKKKKKRYNTSSKAYESILDFVWMKLDDLGQLSSSLSVNCITIVSCFSTTRTLARATTNIKGRVQTIRALIFQHRCVFHASIELEGEGGSKWNNASLFSPNTWYTIAPSKIRISNMSRNQNTHFRFHPFHM